jgi:NAD(P)H-dependent flavin oxidoreductase YrpB (nitropropane dioxygenase family)
MVMPMNGVSDVDLAIVVSEAGAFPSISIFNYYKNNSVDLSYLEKELIKFLDKVGNPNILISMHWEDALNADLIEMLTRLNVKYIELFFRALTHPLWEKISQHICLLRSVGFKILFKTVKLLPMSDYDAIVIKGPKGAGRSFPNTLELHETFGLLKDQIGAQNLIPSGGIGTSAECKYYLDQGALSVGIGTLIAASEESCVSLETKKKILESTSDDIVNIGALNSRGLLFSKLDNDDDNNSRSLRAGIRGTSSGCIYVGNGIDHIKTIMPVKDIIEELIVDVN